MGSLYRPTLKGRGGQRVKCRYYRIAYVNADGKRVTERAYRDRDASLALLRKREREAERARVGLPVVDQDRTRRPLPELTEAWLSELRRLGRSHAHIRDQKRLLTTLWDRCGWKSLAEIRVDRLNAFLADLQVLGRCARTLNSYRDALYSFLGFCRRQHWVEENVLEGHPKARGGGAKRRPRRAYTVKEFRALVKAGGEHALLYRVAGLSGLRKSELRRLEKRDLTPVGPHPTWHLRAEITKGRRKDMVPMIPECAEALAAHWQSLPGPTSKVFPRLPRTETLHKALKRAKVRRVDAEGRHVDFHALRYFFCTLLARKLAIQLVRLLMRHRDIRQTCNLYMDLGLTDVTEAMQTLPRLLDPEDDQGKGKKA